MPELRRPNHLLRTARGHMTQAELADAANAEIHHATGRHGALTPKAISDLERGRYSWPAKPTRDALCKVLGVADAYDLGFSREPWTRQDGRVDHALVRPRATDIATVQDLRSEVQRIADAYDQVPSAGLLAAAGQCHGQIAYLGGEVAHGPVDTELRAAEAQSATVLGQIIWDASQRHDHAGALTYFDQAFAAATSVGDCLTAAHAQLRKSYVALYGTQNPRHGLALAEQAAATASRTSNAITAVAILHVAEARAMLGDYGGCEHALSVAERLIARVRDDDPARAFVSSAEFGRLAGSCYLRLGTPQRAEPLLFEVAGLMCAREKSRAIALGNLALAYIRQGKLDEAAGTTNEAIDVIEATRSGGGFTVVFSAAQELRPWRQEPIVQSLNERLLSLLAVA